MNPIVLVWCAVSVIGLAVSLYLTNESRRDLSALHNRTNGRRLVARSRMLREGVRFTVHALYLVAGLIGLGVLPLSTAAIVPILVYGNVALVANSIIDWRTRPPLFATRGEEPDIPKPGADYGEPV